MPEKTLSDAFPADGSAAAARANREDLQGPESSSEQVLDDRELEDLARGEYEAAMGFGVSLDSFLRLAKTVRAKACQAAAGASSPASRMSKLRDGHSRDLEDTLLEIAALLQSDPQDADALLRTLRERVLRQVAMEELVRRAQEVLALCEAIDPFGSVENAKARDAARDLALRVRAVLAAGHEAWPRGLLCPKCGVDRTRETCPAPSLLDCGIQIHAQACAHATDVGEA